jgi:hypothetical protein
MNTNTNEIMSSKNNPDQSDLFAAEKQNDINTRSLEFSSPLTENASYIDFEEVADPEWDIPNWPSKWKRLELLNRGMYNGKWEQHYLKRQQDDWYLCQAIGCQMSLPGWLKQRLWHIFDSLDMRSFKKYEKRSKYGSTIRRSMSDSSYMTIRPLPQGMRKQYMVIFSICAILYNQERGDHQPRYYPGKKYEQRDRHGAGSRFARNLVDSDFHDCHKLLQQFAERLGFRDNDISSCMEKLRQACPQLSK